MVAEVHNIRRYSTIKMVDDKNTTLAAFSCGPCKLYGKYYRSEEGREKAVREHTHG